MTKLQITLLLIAFGYLFIKGVLFVVLYRHTYAVEKSALTKQKALRKMLSGMRIKDKQKYSKAYELSGLQPNGEIGREGI
ncbi:MAG: hypothetical protein ACM3NT_03355 [Methylocystaceae bacterium]